MNLEGKVVAWSDDEYGIVTFTDGTSLESGEYGFNHVDHEERRRRAAVQQGWREQARMRRLRDSLHPKDKQHLARLERERYAARRAEMGVFQRNFLDEMRIDLNRQAVLLFPRAHRKRKRRPRRPPIGNSFVVPIYRRP